MEVYKSRHRVLWDLITMFAWYGVVVMILNGIFLTYSLNNCIYNYKYITCKGNFDNMPTLSDNLTEYRRVCVYLINWNNLK